MKVSRLTLDQEIEGSNPSSPANNLSTTVFMCGYGHCSPIEPVPPSDSGGTLPSLQDTIHAVGRSFEHCRGQMCVHIGRSGNLRVPQGPGNDPEFLAVLAAIIEIGRALGMSTIAEGIETERQLERLRTMGCPLGQGYLLGRPLDAEAMLELVAGSGAPMAARAA